MQVLEIFKDELSKMASVESVHKRLVEAANQGNRLGILKKKIEAFKALKPRGV